MQSIGSRMKMNSIEYHMMKIYREECGIKIAEIKGCLYDLYLKYKSISNDLPFDRYMWMGSCNNNNGGVGNYSSMDKASSTSMMETEAEDILNDFDNYLEKKSVSKP